MPAAYAPEPDPCVLIAPPSSPAESITVVTTRAGHYRSLPNAAGFAVAQSYDTLLGIDCRGQPYPRFARAWSSEDVAEGRRWTITLDDEARLGNGDRVTANDVLAAWRSTTNSGSGELERVVVAATNVIDDRTLSVTLADATPLILAHESLAIHRARDSSQWRSGRVHARSIDATAARDALDAGADLLVTDDPAIVSYATHRDELVTFRLPWDRTYVVLAAESPAVDVSAALRLTLAELVADAVRADARVAEPPFWWESSVRCAAPMETSLVVPAPRSTRVVYHSGDRVAQGIAERLVAIAARRSSRGEDSALGTLVPGLSRTGARATAAALSPSAYAAALQAGDDVAYVLPLPRFTVAPCHEFAMLLRAAPWLQSVMPLIDTRIYAIVRRGRVGLSVDADGSLRLLDGASGKNAKP